MRRWQRPAYWPALSLRFQVWRHARLLLLELGPFVEAFHGKYSWTIISELGLCCDISVHLPLVSC